MLDIRVLDVVMDLSISHSCNHFMVQSNCQPFSSQLPCETNSFLLIVNKTNTLAINLGVKELFLSCGKLLFVNQDYQSLPIIPLGIITLQN